MTALSPQRGAHRPTLLLALVCLALGFSFVRNAGAEPRPPALATAAQVRSLTEADASGALPVRLQGIFMGQADPEGIAFVIQDETDCIYIQGPPEQVDGLCRGDVLAIEGTTTPGGFAPYVVASLVKKTGHGDVPPPAKVLLDDLNAGQMDAKWVEFTGIVRSVYPKEPSDNAPPPPGTRHMAPSEKAVKPQLPKSKLKIAAGSASVLVEIEGELDPAEYVDAEVRIRGLCFNLHNQNRQFVKPFVQMPKGTLPIVERRPSMQAFSGSPSPVASLMQFHQLSGQNGHRVHVHGVVVHHRPGSALWVRDKDRSLRVETTQIEPLQPGDEVDVLGFPARSEYSAVLEDAVFRKVSSQQAPAPVPLSDIGSALRGDADLVQLDGRLTEVLRFPDSLALTLEWNQTPVRALFYPKRPGAPLPDWQPGSIVRVVGVCSVKTDEASPLGGLWQPRAFQLLLRTPEDLAVLVPPPWWDSRRIIWVLTGFLVFSLGAVAAVMYASKRRIKEQEYRRAMAETEFAAILNERNRVAREVHDTLAQSLGAISLQLELVRTHAAEISTPARTHLGIAHKLARAALADARESIWNMRSQVLERCDLGGALEGILTQATEGTQIVPEMRIEGDRRRLPPVVENNLLRIGQEAITNACKHAQPGRIAVTLSFEGRQVRLRVEDDGVGFLVGAPSSGQRRSYGLVGMEERAELIGATVAIDSAPGKGTRVLVTVSV